MILNSKHIIIKTSSSNSSLYIEIQVKAVIYQITKMDELISPVRTKDIQEEYEGRLSRGPWNNWARVASGPQ